MSADSRTAPAPQDLPLDQAAAGNSWIVLRFLLHAVSGVFSGRVLILALAGLLLAETGVSLILSGEKQIGLIGREAFLAPGLEPPSPPPSGYLELVGRKAGGFWWSMVAPFQQRSESASQAVRQTIAGVWRLVIWSLAGVAIARIAATHMTHNERPTAGTAVRRSLKGWLGQAAGPMVVLVLIGITAGIIRLMAMTVRGVDSLTIEVLAAPFVFVLVLIGATLAIGLAIGAPLMWASQAVERPDPFDAVSCGFAYVYQRPLRLTAYVLQALLVGAFAGAIVLSGTQVASEFLGASWGVGAEPPEVSSTWPGDLCEDLCLFLLRWTPIVFHAAYFWFAAVAVYLLMRRDIDEKQTDEIYLDESPPSAT